MNKSIYESCANCANIYICSGSDYIDGSCDLDLNLKIKVKIKIIIRRF